MCALYDYTLCLLYNITTICVLYTKIFFAYRIVWLEDLQCTGFMDYFTTKVRMMKTKRSLTTPSSAGALSPTTSMTGHLWKQTPSNIPITQAHVDEISESIMKSSPQGLGIQHRATAVHFQIPAAEKESDIHQATFFTKYAFFSY